MINEPGTYWKDEEQGIWCCCTPNGMIGNLSRHNVVEHEDGTITVSPSILITIPNHPELGRYHGFLKKGEWQTLKDTTPLLPEGGADDPEHN